MSSGQQQQQQQQHQQHRLPTLREVDCQQELVNMAAAVLTAAVSGQHHRELQQQQLQQQQQQYAILLAQAVQQQQQAGLVPNVLANYTNSNTPNQVTPPGFNSNNQSSPNFFQFQAIAGVPQHPTGSPALFHHSPTSSYTQLSTAASPAAPSPGSSSSARPSTSSPFILPLSEGTDQSGSHDSGLGSGQYLGTAAVAAQQRSIEVIRRLQLIGETDSNGAGASVNSLQSSDSDRLRMDSSLESMTSGGGSGRPSLPTLHQQLEYLRLGSEECRSPTGGTLRRNGPFITRSTSEKVPHRNEILAQVQRTAWARHTTK